MIAEALLGALDVLLVIALCVVIRDPPVTMRCYIDGCKTTKTIPLRWWLHGFLLTWDLHFFVCEPHYGVFDEREA